MLCSYFNFSLFSSVKPLRVWNLQVLGSWLHEGLQVFGPCYQLVFLLHWRFEAHWDKYFNVFHHVLFVVHFQLLHPSSKKVSGPPGKWFPTQTYQHLGDVENIIWVHFDIGFTLFQHLFNQKPSFHRTNGWIKLFTQRSKSKWFILTRSYPA